MDSPTTYVADKLSWTLLDWVASRSLTERYEFKRARHVSVKRDPGTLVVTSPDSDRVSLCSSVLYPKITRQQYDVFLSRHESSNAIAAAAAV